MTKDVCTKENIPKMTCRLERSMRHFSYVFLGINIFCHTYIALYIFLYIF